METPFCRTEKMFGEAAMRVFFGARVAVFGAGGVGGYTIEALARAGIGALDIVDSDAVSISNINRQIIATHATVGDSPAATPTGMAPRSSKTGTMAVKNVSRIS